MNEIELIKDVPKFPKTSSSRKHDGENFIDLDTQALIINSIENPLYRAAIKTLAIYMLRPCEVRALRVKDVDFEKNLITISHHFSKNVLLKGRKSDNKKQNTEIHRLPITPSFIEILESIEFSDSWSQNRFLFSYSETKPLGIKTPTTHWKKQLIKLDFRAYLYTRARGMQAYQILLGVG